MAPWIPITIAAAFFQNLRSALQRNLRGRLSTLGAAYARFLYAWPVALAYLAFVAWLSEAPLPRPGGRFLLYVLAGAISQILFTALLLRLFGLRNFAVGTVFSKLEVVMVAVLGALLLGDRLGPAGVVAVALSALGVMALSMQGVRLTPCTLVDALGHGATLLGLACAATLGASVVFFRGASLALDAANAALAAATTFAVAVVVQTLLMGAFLRLAQPGELSAVLRYWRPAGAAGVAGAFASIGWFTAFTLENAAYVRALGQVELVFTFLSSVLIFGEKVRLREVIGTLLIVAAILILLLVS